MADIGIYLAIQALRVVAQAPLVSFASFVFVYVFVGQNLLRPVGPHARKFPRVHVLQTIAALLLAATGLDFLPQISFLFVSGAVFVVSNFLLSINPLAEDVRNQWNVWYRLFGWGGLATCAVSSVLISRMQGLDVEKEYDLYFQLQMVPMLLNFSFGVFIVNFLVAPEIGDKAREFFSQFPDAAKVQQSRDVFLAASVSLPLALLGGWFGLYITAQSGFLYWFSNMMLHYSAELGTSRIFTRYLLTWAGFTACFVSAFLQNLTFKMDANKAYSLFRSLQFLYGLMNSSLAAIGCFTSTMDVLTQYSLMRGVTRTDIRLPARIATTIGSVLLMSTNLSAYADAPKSFVAVSTLSSVTFAGSFILYEFTRQARRQGEVERYRQDFVRSVVLSTGSLASFISTYCFAYAVFLLDKERSADIVDFVTTIARYSNASLGAVVAFHVLIVENLEPVFDFLDYALGKLGDVLGAVFQVLQQAYLGVEQAYIRIVAIVHPILERIALAARDLFLRIRPFLRQMYAALRRQVLKVVDVLVHVGTAVVRVASNIALQLWAVAVSVVETLVLWGRAVVQWSIDLARRLNVRYYYEQFLLAIEQSFNAIRDTAEAIATQVKAGAYRAYEVVIEVAVVVGQRLLEIYQVIEAAVDAILLRIEEFILHFVEIMRPYVEAILRQLSYVVAWASHYVAIGLEWVDALLTTVLRFLEDRIDAVVRVVSDIHESIVGTLEQALQAVGLDLEIIPVTSGACFMIAGLGINAPDLTFAAGIPLFFTRQYGLLGFSMMTTVPAFYLASSPGTYEYLLPTLANAVVGPALIFLNFEALLNMERLDFPLASKVGLNCAAVLLLAALVVRSSAARTTVLMQACIVQYGSYLVRRRRDYWRTFAQVSSVGSYVAALLFRHSMFTMARDDKYLGLIMNSMAIALSGGLSFSMLYFQLVEFARQRV